MLGLQAGWQIQCRTQWEGTSKQGQGRISPAEHGGTEEISPQVKTVNMIYATHIPKRERKRALRDVYTMDPVVPKLNPWSASPITFDRRDHPTSIRHDGSAALVLDPIIEGFHLT